MSSTGPAPSGRRSPVSRTIALLRNSWRQLTSMRTALVLLFLLAVAAVPGSVLPQRTVSIEDVNEYFREHPELAPVLDRLGGFDVFGSVWFSAIYLLLFTSLVGCIVPRLRDHLRALRTPPPAAPKRLDRLPQHAVIPARDPDPRAIAAVLRRRGWRVVVRGDAVSAEKGYLKETGNLLFHLSLVVVLIGMAIGSWYGWHGNRIVVAGPDSAFCNTLLQYDESGLGPRVDSAKLPRFCLELTDFAATFTDGGQAQSYRATVLVDEAGGAPRHADFSVNSPLRLDGANVYLLGHGYAPVIRYTDRYGQTQTTVAPFLTRDANLTSEGVAAFPDANVDPRTGERDPSLQVAFEGLYLPTAPEEPPFIRSQHPEERAPAVLLIPYRGNLGLDAGIPGSVYQLDQRQVRSGKLTQIDTGKLLRPGETWTLDDGSTVEFVGTRPYVTLSVRHDPGQLIVLVGAGLLILGLTTMLLGRRRRVWFRTTPSDESTTSGSSFVEAGGLPRTDYPGFADEFRELVAVVQGGGNAADDRGETSDRDAAGVREGTP
ncbi:MAG TPA: cytochrome c biogenesis protein ResB [Micromonosporaceae bacterium]